MGLSRSEIWAFVHGERRTLAAVLATLSAEEWAAESLCSGWTVKDVAAHVIAHPEVRLRTAVPGLLQAWQLRRIRLQPGQASFQPAY